MELVDTVDLESISFKSAGSSPVESIAPLVELVDTVDLKSTP